MSELKFKAYIKPLKRYATGLDTIQFHKCCDVEGAGIWTVVTVNEGIFEGDDIIIEQCTGLKDKNSKEIYEGDIVNVIGIGIAQVIDSPSGEWMIYYKRESDEIKNGFACVVPKNKPSGLWKASLTSYVEVIGNMHENSGLLEDEE